MDPIIKTIRISPSSFALDLHQPKAGQKMPAGLPDKKNSIPVHTPLSSTKEENRPSGVNHESILNAASIDRLISKTITSQSTQENIEESDSSNEKAEIEKAYAKAKQEGYLAGLEAAKEKGQKDLNAALKQITDLLHSLKDIHEVLFQEIENSAVEVVFEAVAKIIGHAAIDKKMAYNITREAIEQVKNRDKIIIRVSTQDYEMINAALHQADNAELLKKNLTVVADNLVQLGGCLIETEAGSIDARLEIQLQRLKDTLLGVRKTNEDV